MSIKDQMNKEFEAPKFDVPQEQAQEATLPTPNLLRMLRRKAKKTDLSEYREHPLNFDKKDSTGKIIRGLEGMIGSLDLAILDVLSGVAEKITGRETQTKKPLYEGEEITDRGVKIVAP